MNWLTRLLKARISINIITPPPEGVKHSTVPRQVEVDSPTIKRNRKSNLRFVEERKTDCFGVESSYSVYYTEEYVGGKWSCISDSIKCDREKAIELHLKLLDQVSLKDIKVKTVLWEGLGVEETKTWATLAK